MNKEQKNTQFVSIAVHFGKSRCIIMFIYPDIYTAYISKCIAKTIVFRFFKMTCFAT